jgi:hypothetical protein
MEEQEEMTKEEEMKKKEEEEAADRSYNRVYNSKYSYAANDDIEHIPHGNVTKEGAIVQYPEENDNSKLIPYYANLLEVHDLAGKKRINPFKDLGEKAKNSFNKFGEKVKTSFKGFGGKKNRKTKKRKLLSRKSKKSQRTKRTKRTKRSKKH